MSAEDPSHFEHVRRFRQAERAQHLETLRELAEEARKRAKSHYTPSKERAKWVKLAGQLLWYKDQVLRSMTYESLEMEVAELKQIVFKKDKPPERKPQTGTG